MVKSGRERGEINLAGYTLILVDSNRNGEKWERKGRDQSRSPKPMEVSR